jgi:hypothetical protein
MFFVCQVLFFEAKATIKIVWMHQKYYSGHYVSFTIQE